MMNTSRFTLQDYRDLNGAISRIAPKIRFLYMLPNTWQFLIDSKAIAGQTGATSDYDKLHKRYKFISKYEHNLREVHLATYGKRGFHLGELVGLKDMEICVFNPKNPIPAVKVGGREARLVKIDGLDCSNNCDARVDFERGIAFLSEEDQDIAHRLGLMYTPVGGIGMDTPFSNEDLHKNKVKMDESGNPILYCKYPACQKQIRNPVLIVDEPTRGFYHSEICFERDRKVKIVSSKERKESKLQSLPVKISLEDALAMCKME